MPARVITTWPCDGLFGIKDVSYPDLAVNFPFNCVYPQQKMVYKPISVDQIEIREEKDKLLFAPSHL